MPFTPFKPDAPARTRHLLSRRPAASLMLAVALGAGPMGASMAASNIIPSAVTTPIVTGTAGLLRDSQWQLGSNTPDVSYIWDGVFNAVGSQWNNNTFWWDVIGAGTVHLELQLDQAYLFEGFTLQGDNNDTYTVEYWNGAGWVGGWQAPALNTFGMETRSSVGMTPFTSNALRLSAIDGDGWYSIGEFQAFATPVPEPHGLALLGLSALTLTGLAQRRRAQRRTLGKA